MPIPKCPIWNTDANVDPTDRDQLSVLSPRAGGRYAITGTAVAMLETLSPIEKAKLSTWIVDQNRFNAVPLISSDILENLSRQKPLELETRVIRLLDYFSRSAGRIGKPVPYSVAGNDDGNDSTASELYACSESIESEEVEFLIKYLKEVGLIEEDSWGGSHSEIAGQIVVTVRGYEALREEKGRLSPSQAFVAMWFAEEMDTPYNIGIAPGIIDAGYRPLRIDKKDHANKIDDEIISEIRRSRFVVADFTCGLAGSGEVVPRGGVYYEAGFAQGLGIPVIWLCRANQIEKVHFDTRQFNHIVWAEPNGLRKALRNRIGAVIGDGPERS